jgi:HEAT repeat protein
MAAALSVLMLGGCGRVSPGFDSRDLIQSLDHILLWHQKNAPALAATLQPGLSRSEIEKLARQHHVVLSEEVYALYGWRNGAHERTPFFDVYQFVPLSEALEAGDFIHQTDPAHTYRLPIFQSILSNDGYDVACARKPQAQTPVEFFLDGVPTPDMDDVTAFLRALAASFEQGVFTASDDGELDTNQPAFERTLLNFRPRRKADVETVLGGRGASLPAAREMRAYQDLTQTEHPRTEELISHAMGRWLYHHDSRFSGLLVLAQLNTQGSLTRLEEAARDGDPEIRRDAYSVLGWQTQWGEKRLDAATEKMALLDLLNLNPKLCDEREIARVLYWAPDNRPVPSLIGLLDAFRGSCARDTSIAAAEALGQLGDRSAVAPLLARLKIETDLGAQLVMMAALADLGNSEGERQLRFRLDSFDRNSLWNAASDSGRGSAAERRIAAELLAHIEKR